LHNKGAGTMFCQKASGGNPGWGTGGGAWGQGETLGTKGETEGRGLAALERKSTNGGIWGGERSKQRLKKKKSQPRKPPGGGANRKKSKTDEISPNARGQGRSKKKRQKAGNGGAVGEKKRREDRLGKRKPATKKEMAITIEKIQETEVAKGRKNQHAERVKGKPTKSRNRAGRFTEAHFRCGRGKDKRQKTADGVGEERGGGNRGDKGEKITSIKGERKGKELGREIVLSTGKESNAQSCRPSLEKKKNERGKAVELVLREENRGSSNQLQILPGGVAKKKKTPWRSESQKTRTGFKGREEEKGREI